MRKTGKAKTLLTMLLAAAALQAGTAFGAQDGNRLDPDCKRLVLPAARERTYGNWHAAHE